MSNPATQIESCPVTAQPCELAAVCTERAFLIDNEINPDNPGDIMGGLVDPDIDRVVSNPVACIQETIRRFNLLEVRVAGDQSALGEVYILQTTAAHVVEAYRAS